MSDKSERITAIEKSIEGLRKAYNTIKTDLALVERRRKKIKRKERERAERSEDSRAEKTTAEADGSS